MKYAGLKPSGRFATYLAECSIAPYKARGYLARVCPSGYVASNASICHDDIILGKHVFIGDHVTIYQAKQGGPVKIGSGSRIHKDTVIETGLGGSLTVGPGTHIQPRCHFSAYKGSILIANDVQVAPNCAFYSYDHGYGAGQLIKKQPIQTKGGILIDEDVWIGVAVTILDGVNVGKGAVIGAGSVVTKSVPNGAVVAGNPARVLQMRNGT